MKGKQKYAYISSIQQIYLLGYKQSDRKQETRNFPLIHSKGDNCNTQYCCFYIFERYLKTIENPSQQIALGVGSYNVLLRNSISSLGLIFTLRRAITAGNLFSTVMGSLLNS